MRFSNIEYAIDYLRDTLKHRSEKVTTKTWQGVSTDNHPEMATHEVINQFITVPVSRLPDMVQQIKPSLPWADEHFAERISGEPLNPPPSWKHWPHAHSAARFTKDGMFSHTYPERFWPKLAGECPTSTTPGAELPNVGIRYALGDLGDVIELLKRDPNTRQAYLPVFFPEDTGAVHGERIPCSLGYHFMVRGNRMHMAYFIRSCDFVRHLRDDLYLAVKLQMHVREQVGVELVGDFSFWIGSLHCFVNDMRDL